MRWNQFSSMYIEVLLILLLLSGNLNAQINRNYLYTYPAFEDDNAGNLFLRLETNSFIKNNEYFGNFIEGYTLLGYSLQPTFMYYATSKLRFKAGVHLLKYDGDTGINKVLPVFSAHLKFSNRLELIMGALKGGMQHRLLEPVFDPENQYKRPVENGVQFLYKSNRFCFDTWIDWDQFIFHGDTIPEMFTAGINSEFELSNTPSAIQLSLPFQFVARHIGGQISNYREELKTLVNIVVGVKLEKRFEAQFFRKINLDTYYLTYNDLTKGTGYGFSFGHAVYPTISAAHKYGELMIGYWNAGNFMAARGSSLFHSISSRDYPFYRKNRQMINAKLSYVKEFTPQLKFSAMFESYYDVDDAAFEYSYGINLIFTPDFFIKNVHFN